MNGNKMVETYREAHNARNQTLGSNNHYYLVDPRLGVNDIR